MKKRILSLILAFAMAATLAPATALVGSSTAKAANVTNVIIKEVADNEYPAKTWATADDNLKAPTGSSITSLTVTAARGTDKTVKYLKSNIPWADASDNNNAGTLARYVQFEPVSSQTTRASWIGLPNFTFEARSASAEIKAGTDATGFVASVAKLTFDVPKTTPAGTYVVAYKPVLTGTGANTDKVDLNGDGDTGNDEFIITVIVTDPLSEWVNLGITSTPAFADGKIYDAERGKAVSLSLAQNIIGAKYDVVKSGTTANQFGDTDIKTEVAAENKTYGSLAGSAGTLSDSDTVATNTGNQTNANIKASVKTGAPNGTYYFSVKQYLGGALVNSTRFGISVGMGGVVTLDPKGGEIYDAEFAKDGSVYVAEYEKNYNAFDSTRYLPTPIKSDELFEGWYLENTNNTKYTDGNSINVGTGIGYYAKWTKNAPVIALMSGVSGVGNSSTGSIKLGDKLASKSNVLERAGYDLVGWSVRPGATIKMYDVMDTVTVDMVKTIQAANNNNSLYAVWAPKTFKISFDAGLPKDGKLSDYSATSMDPITWSTNKTMTFTEWTTATANKFHIWGYKFIGWSRELGSSNTGGNATKAVYNENTGNDFAPSSANVIDIADLQNPSAQDITLYATWEPKIASYITLKEESGSDLNKIMDVGDKAPDTAGRVGYFVEKWTEGTNEWLPESDSNSTAVQKSNAVLVPKFRAEGIEYNMILAATHTDDYSVSNGSIGEMQGDAHLVTFSADQRTVLLPDRKTADSDVATFVGYEAWVSSEAGTITHNSKRSDVANNVRTSDNLTGWVKLDGIFKGSFNSLDIIAAIEKTDAKKYWATNKSDGVVFFYPVWKYNLADAKLSGATVNSKNITVNYGTSMATIQNVLLGGAQFYVKKNNQLTVITAPDVSAGITLSGSYNPLKAGRYNLKATIRPRDNVSTNQASFVKDVVVNVRSKAASGFADTDVVATGFTAIPDINLASGANVQDVLAALAKVYRVEVSADNSAKYGLELAEVGRAMEWMYKTVSAPTSPNSTNYGSSIVTNTTRDNGKFITAYDANSNSTTTFNNVTFTFALPVDSSLKNAAETGKNSGNLAYIGNDINAATTNDQNGNKFVLVDVNIGAGNKPVVTPAEPEVKEEDPDRPVIAAGPVYRIYNKNNGDHYFTTDASEKNALQAMGLQVDAVTFSSADSNDANAKPVYCLYNPNSGEHFYTMSKGERNSIVKSGWQYHGVKFYAYSANSNLGKAVYRLFSPQATNAGSHHITGSVGEYNALGKNGWNKEGVAFRAVKAN